MFLVLQVLKALWMKEFKLRKNSYKFDSSGDINLGYDVIMWRSDGGNIYVHNIVAEYHPHSNNLTHTNHSSTQQLQNLKVSPYSDVILCKHTTHTHSLQCVFTQNI